MSNLKKLQRTALGLTLLASGIFFAACDSSDLVEEGFATSEVQDLYTSVASELNMTSDQRAKFGRALQQHDRQDREPGYLWIVADSLSQTLTDEQINELLSGTEPREGFHPFMGLRGFVGGGGYYGFGGLRGAMGRFGDAGPDSEIELTDEQEEAIRALHENLRTDVRNLKDQRDAGTLSDEEFVRSLKELHESLKAGLDEILTDEQKATLEEFRAEREAEFEAFRAEVNEVRNEVLALTSDQIEAMNTIFQDHLDMREVLNEQFLAGELTLAELRDEIESLREASDAALEALLSEDQYLIVQIHNALAVRMGLKGHIHRHGPGPR